MDSARVLLLLGAFCALAAASKLGEKITVHGSEKETDEKTKNFKRVWFLALLIVTGSSHNMN